jgi:hypothetical protein
MRLVGRVAELGSLGVVTHMTTSTRRKLGAAILSTSIIAGIVLSLSGTSLVSVEQSHTSAQGDGSFIWSGVFSLHWPLVALLAAGVTGLLLLLIRRHEKTNA